MGADAAFAKALARSEFGRFYTDDREQREIALSLARGRGTPYQGRPQAQEHKIQDKKVVFKRVVPWRPPSVRTRRSEIASALARLMAEARLRGENEEEW
jgi:hypothetical protein